MVPSLACRKQPIQYDVAKYRQRNKVEGVVNRLKPFRRVATRYDKLAATTLASVHLSSALIMIR